MRAGEQLKDLRKRLQITTREVEEYTRRIGEAEGNEEFYISNPWLTQVENTESIPSIYKLYSLSVVYRTKFTDLLLLYGVDLDKIADHQLSLPLDRTHLTTVEVYDKNRESVFRFASIRDSGQRRPTWCRGWSKSGERYPSR